MKKGFVFFFVGFFVLTSSVYDGEKVYFSAEQEIKKEEVSFDAINFSLPDDVLQTVKEGLSLLPSSHMSSLEQVIGEYGNDKRRGMASFRSLYLGLDVLKEKQEILSVVIHEMGHVVDLGMLLPSDASKKTPFYDGTQVVYQSDISTDFYFLCFQDSYTENGKCTEKDFVSRYARTNVFEDFSESYVLFVLYNDSFKKMAEESEVLQKKYSFLENIFEGYEYEGYHEDFHKEERVFDVTKIF
jgi:hypothetical protein